MSVSFEGVPSTILVPLFYAEMDNSKANTAQTSGASLLIGQALTDAPIARNQLVLMPSADQARKLCGQGSQLARMVDAYRKTDPFGELYVVAVSDIDKGQNATASIAISGKVTAAGAISLYVGSTRVEGVVSADDTALQAAQSLADAINAIADLPVTASASLEGIPLTGLEVKVLGPHEREVGAFFPMEVIRTPENTTDTGFTWSLVPQGIVSISQNSVNGANFEALQEGEVTVSVASDDGDIVSPGVILTVVAPTNRVLSGSDGPTLPRRAAPMNAKTKAVIPASSPAAKVTLTAKYPGGSVNDFPLVVNYYGPTGGEETPAGLNVQISGFSGGAGSADLAPVIASLGDEPFDFIGLPFNDANSLALVREEMNDTTGRWAWSRQLYGHVYTAKVAGLIDLVEFGDSFNDQHLTVCGYEVGTQSPVDELIAGRLGRQAAFIRNDPARPTQTGEISGALPAPVGTRYQITERQSLLSHGIATSTVSGGALLIERDVTTYKKNKFGVTDNSYLDSETLHTSAYVLRKLKTVITSKYPRHKLANDGTRFGQGQAIVTPSVLKGEICAAYRQMELAGIVENFDTFKKYLIVERNADNPNRVDVLFPPDYVNQLRVFGVVNQFRLQYSDEEINA